jgi:hypothetical protein
VDILSPFREAKFSLQPSKLTQHTFQPSAFLSTKGASISSLHLASALLRLTGTPSIPNIFY